MDQNTLLKQIQNIKSPLNCPTVTLSDISQQSPLYQGQYCDVYAINKYGKQLALKIIYIERITQDFQQKINRICSQIKILYSIHHQNIVQLLGHFCTEGAIVLIFPFFGKTLYDFIKERKKKNSKKQYTVNDFIKIFRGIGSGLVELHAMGYIHRDISEDNILIDDNYNIKIIDLESVGRIQNSSGTYGTRQYLAPQILQGKFYNHRVDVWAFGIICYQLLYCTYLFKPKIKNLQQLGQDQINEHYLNNMKQPIQDFPDDKLLVDQKPSPQLMTFLKSILSFNPDKRPQIGYLLSKSIFGAQQRQAFSYNMEQYVRQKTSRRTYKVHPGLHSNVKQMSVRELEQTLLDLVLLQSKELSKQKQLFVILAKQQISKYKIKGHNKIQSVQEFF